MWCNFILSYDCCGKALKIHYQDFDSFDKVWPIDRFMLQEQKQGRVVRPLQAWIESLETKIEFSAEPVLKKTYSSGMGNTFVEAYRTMKLEEPTIQDLIEIPPFSTLKAELDTCRAQDALSAGISQAKPLDAVAAAAGDGAGNDHIDEVQAVQLEDDGTPLQRGPMSEDAATLKAAMLRAAFHSHGECKPLAAKTEAMQIVQGNDQLFDWQGIFGKEMRVRFVDVDGGKQKSRHPHLQGCSVSPDVANRIQSMVAHAKSGDCCVVFSGKSCGSLTFEKRQKVVELLCEKDGDDKPILKLFEMQFEFDENVGNSARARGVGGAGNVESIIIGTVDKDLYYIRKVDRINKCGTSHSNVFRGPGIVRPKFKQCVQVTPEDKKGILAGYATSGKTGVTLDLDSIATVVQRARWTKKRAKRVKRVTGLLPLVWHQKPVPGVMELLKALHCVRAVIYLDTSGTIECAAMAFGLKSRFSLVNNELHARFIDKRVDEHALKAKQYKNHKHFQGDAAAEKLRMAFPSLY